MMDENKQVVEPDLYDNTVEGIAQFAGIFMGVITRYVTSRVIPQNDTIMKMVFRETGSIALATAAMGITSQSVKAIGAYLKPFVMK